MNMIDCNGDKIMPEKKKHHYVPKFYLKEFANDKGEFAVFNLKDEKCIEAVPYNSQCYKDYFYGKDGIWEERLGEMETKWAIVLKKIKAKDILLENDLKLLKQFAVYQRQRTFATSEYFKQGRFDLVMGYGKMLYANKGWIFDDEAERICKDRALSEITPAENLEIAMRLVKYLDDLGILIINYNTRKELVSSDVPVVVINPFHKYTIGYGCMGLIIFFPVSRHKLAVIYDDKMYTHFKNVQYVDMDDEVEVCNLNAYQYISAEKILFSYRTEDMCDFSDSVKVARKKCREKGAISTMGPDNYKIFFGGMRLTLYDCDLSFGQLPHQYKRIPFICREAVPRKWQMEWERKLNINKQVMSEFVKIDPDSGLTKKDLKLGYRRMASVAKKYWNNKGK